MANILALDSSTDACSVALYRNGEVTSLFELAAKSHTQRLLPMVDELLQSANCTLAGIDAIAFGCGPGSFTGLRICLGIVQGLAFGSNLPVIPVSTLAAVAAGYWRQESVACASLIREPLLIALDARMDEVYWAIFESSEKYLEPALVGEESVMSPSLVASHEKVRALKKQFIAVGPGWHYTDLAAIKPDRVVMEAYPYAEDIARIAAEKFSRGEMIPVQQAEPVYLRNSVSWQKRQRIRSASQTL